MKHKADKYTYRIEWSEEDKAHVARCLEFPSLAAHGKTSEEALNEIVRSQKPLNGWTRSMSRYRNRWV